MAVFANVAGVKTELAGMWAGIGGVKTELQSMYAGVAGVKQEIYSSGPPATLSGWVYTTNTIATLITGYTGTETNVIVPKRLNGQPVVLSNSTFTNNRNITSVDYLPGVYYLYAGVYSSSMYNAFRNCTALVDVKNIPNSVGSMHYAFFDCTNLTTAPIIPNSVTNMYGAFWNCKNLTTAPIIPNGVTYITSAFRNCPNLTGNIYVDSNVVINCYRTFHSSSKPKTVYVREGSYEVLNATYGGGQNGVTLVKWI